MTVWETGGRGRERDDKCGRREGGGERGMTVWETGGRGRERDDSVGDGREGEREG